MSPITLYCSWPDVTNRLGVDGADARIDDDPTTQQDVLESAAVEVNGYLQLTYEISALAQSNWVRFKTRDIAVYLLCLRRNHPAPQSVQAQYEKAIADLERVQAGAMKVPDAYESKANVPVLSNQRVTLSPFPRVVNVPGKSTGKQEGYAPFNDQLDNFDYGM